MLQLLPFQTAYRVHIFHLFIYFCKAIHYIFLYSNFSERAFYTNPLAWSGTEVKYLMVSVEFRSLLSLEGAQRAGWNPAASWLVGSQPFSFRPSLQGSICPVGTKQHGSVTFPCEAGGAGHPDLAPPVSHQLSFFPLPSSDPCIVRPLDCVFQNLASEPQRVTPGGP